MTARHSVQHSGESPKSVQVSQEFTVATSAPLRRAAHAVVALAIAGPAVLLGSGVAWAEPSPDPAVSAPAGEAPVDELVAPPDLPEAPAEPIIGTWITGGTLQEGSAAKPLAKPAPAARTVAPVHATHATHSAARIRTRSATHTATTRTPARAPDGATALPFTGGPMDVLLPVGIAMLVGGVALTWVARPRRAYA